MSKALTGDPSPAMRAWTVSQSAGGGDFGCQNNSVIAGVTCVGSIAVLPISVDIKNAGVLNNNDLTILSGDLNDLSVRDGGVLNNNKILDDVEVTMLDDFLNKFSIDVTRNDIDVCTLLLGIQLCK